MTTHCTLVLLVLLGLIAPGLAVGEITERHALVIGNSQYSSFTVLKNPENDAVAMGEKLKSLGFSVTVLQNVSLQEMRKSLEDFTDRLNAQSVAVVFYAGHGVQQDQHNYLIPANAVIKPSRQLQDETMPLRSVISALDQSPAPLRIIMLDACRDNPLSALNPLTRSGRKSNGLAQTTASFGTILSYATQPDNVALDGNTKNSPYTEALLKRLSTPDISVGDMLNLVGNDVLTATGGTQQSWQSSSPIPQFCFNGCKSVSGTTGLANSIATIAEQIKSRNLQSLRESVSLSRNSQLRLQALFDSYSKFDYNIGEIKYAKDNQNATALLTLTRATTQQGKLVFPGSAWSQLQLTLRQNGQSWKVTQINSDYLDKPPPLSTVDIFAPDVTLESNTELVLQNQAVRINAVITDDSDIEAGAVYFRDREQGGRYKSSPLIDSGDGRNFTARLVTGFKTSGALEVYTEVADIHSNRVQSPRKRQPVVINFRTAAEKNKAPATTSRRWWYIALGILATGAILSQSDGGSDDNSGGGSRPVLITTPLP